MGLFIDVEIKPQSCEPGCRACIEVCPVDIFAMNGDQVASLEENEDECTLCDLCLERCPVKIITINKLYATA